MGELQAKRDMIDVTQGGMFSGSPADPVKVYVAGLTRYFHGEAEIDEAEFQHLMGTHVPLGGQDAPLTRFNDAVATLYEIAVVRPLTPVVEWLARRLDRRYGTR